MFLAQFFGRRFDALLPKVFPAFQDRFNPWVFGHGILLGWLAVQCVIDHDACRPPPPLYRPQVNSDCVCGLCL